MPSALKTQPSKSVPIPTCPAPTTVAACTTASFWFAPQQLATVSYAISAVTGLVLLGLLVLLVVATARARHERRAVADEPSPEPGVDAAVLRLGAAAAVALGLGVGLVGAWIFAVRAGVLLGVGVGVLAWLGMTSRRLLWLALVPLAVIPLLYVLQPSSGTGGFFGFADQHLAAHWLAVAAVCAVAAACLLDAWRVRRASPEVDPSP